jgi:2-oxoisovalerate dehydrogenase E1 component
MGSTRPVPHGIDPDEAIADFALAATSRAIDDREISLQKQSKVFFEISGAGHESLGVGLARHLRPAYDWFFPYYRDLALVLGLGVTPYETLLQAVGAADDPASGGRMMPAHWGDARLNIVTQSSPTGSQMLGAVGCAEASRYIGHHDGLPGCVAHADELTYVSRVARRGRLLRGRGVGRPQHRVHAQAPVADRGRRQRMGDLGTGS